MMPLRKKRRRNERGAETNKQKKAPPGIFLDALTIRHLGKGHASFCGGMLSRGIGDHN
jgi:hypothetical protein